MLHARGSSSVLHGMLAPSTRTWQRVCSEGLWTHSEGLWAHLVSVEVKGQSTQSWLMLPQHTKEPAEHGAGAAAPQGTL